MSSFSYEEAFAPSGTRGSFSYEDAVGPKPIKQSKDRFADDLAETIREANPFTRQIAGFGTALRGAYEGAKQLVGQGNPEAIRNNRQIAAAAPVSAFAGNLAMSSIPFALAGNSVRAAAGVGAGMGALDPIEGEDVLTGKLKSTALGFGLGAAGQWGANKIANRFSRKTADGYDESIRNAPRDAAIRQWIDAGGAVPVAQSNPTLMNQMMSSFAGKENIKQAASLRNEELTQKLARRALGMADDTPFSHETLDDVASAAYKRGYEPITRAGQMKATPDYDQALSAIVQRSDDGSRSFPGMASPEIGALVDGFRAADGAFDAKHAIGAIRKLRQDVDAFYRSPLKRPEDFEVVKAKKEIVGALDNEIERNLTAMGKDGEDMLKAYRDSRKTIAQASTTKSAIKGDSIDPRVWGRRADKGKINQDEFKLIGDIASRFPTAFQTPEQIGGAGVNALTALIGGAGGFAGNGDPLSGAATGALGALGARYAIRNALMAPSIQRRLAIPSYAPSRSLRVGNALSLYAPASGTVLGLEALDQ